MDLSRDMSVSTMDTNSDQHIVSSSSDLRPNRSTFQIKKTVTYKRLTFDDSEISKLADSPDQEIVLSYINSNDSVSECSDVEESPISFHYVLSDTIFSDDGRLDVVKKLAKTWKIAYKSAQDNALKDIVELILHSAGCKVKLSLDEFKEAKTDKDIIQTWINNTPHRYLGVDPIRNDRCVERLTLFMRHALNMDSVMMNSQFMEQLYNLTTLMIESKYVNCRFAATNMGAILVRRFIRFEEKFELDNENETESTREYIGFWLKQFVDLTLQSLRDVKCFIQIFVFDVLYDWFNLRPDKFVEDRYLRYVTLLLTDKNPSTRSRAVQICRWLFSSEGRFATGSLDKFKEKSAPELFKRINDQSSTVAADAVKAIGVLVRNTDIRQLNKRNAPTLSLDKIYQLIYVNNRGKVACAAAGVLCDTLAQQSSTVEGFLIHLAQFLRDSNQVFQMRNCEEVIVVSIFGHALNKLTDWSAWTTLLLGDKLTTELRPLACNLLATVINYIGTLAELRLSYPLKPLFDEGKDEVISNKSKKTKEQATKMLESMTAEFAPNFEQLMRKYSKTCVSSLLVIPQHFLDVETVDLKQLYKLLIDCLQTNTSSRDSICQSLAHIHRVMSTSARWKEELQPFEEIIWGTVTKHYLKSCKKITTNIIEEEVVKHKQNIIVGEAFSLYFNLSSSHFPEQALKALQHGINKKHEAVVCSSAGIALQQIKWQLNVIMKTADCSQKTLDALRNYIFDTFSQLEIMINLQSQKVRNVAYSLLTRFLLLFNTNNPLMAPYPALHLPPPSLILSEWLNFQLHIKLTPWTSAPADNKNFMDAKVALSDFILCLGLGVLNTTYLSTVLPLFRMYRSEKNYNNILERLSILVETECSHPKIIESFAILEEMGMDDQMKTEIANGFCAVVMRKIQPAQTCDHLVMSLLNIGLTHVKSNNQLFLLNTLAPFASLISKPKAALMKRKAEEHFAEQLDSDYVQNFINAFCQQLKNLIISSSQESNVLSQSSSQ